MIIINENKNFLFRYLILLIHILFIIISQFNNFSSREVDLSFDIKKIKLFLLKDYIQKGDFNLPEMTAKLICTLETAMHRAMQEKQYSAVASNAKVLMKLVGLEAKVKS